MAESFELSSNVGVASLANDVYNSREGRKLWIKRLKQFGLARTHRYRYFWGSDSRD
jgi:cell division protein FtsI/penicillin-binding protein 2